MKTTLVPIGNSKGVRIPKAILEQCHFTKDIDLSVEGNSIVLKPVINKSRRDWGKAFKSMHTNGHDKLIIDDGLDLQDKDWQW